jgi:hypothetical protein
MASSFFHFQFYSFLLQFPLKINAFNLLSGILELEKSSSMCFDRSKPYQIYQNLTFMAILPPKNLIFMATSFFHFQIPSNFPRKPNKNSSNFPFFVVCSTPSAIWTAMFFLSLAESAWAKGKRCDELGPGANQT